MNDQRSTMDTDIVCVGFGPATGGFLNTLSRAMVDAQGNTLLESRVMPGMPLQVLCYERADDIAFGVSGVVTPARALRASFTAEQLAEVPMATSVTREEVLYLQDPVGASRRSAGVKALDAFLNAMQGALPIADHALALPWIPPFLAKRRDDLLTRPTQSMGWRAGDGIWARADLARHASGRGADRERRRGGRATRGSGRRARRHANRRLYAGNGRARRVDRGR